MKFMVFIYKRVRLLPWQSNKELIWPPNVSNNRKLNTWSKHFRDLPCGPWLRICLPVEGTQVLSLIHEDPTCCRANKLVCRNYWARAATNEACVPRSSTTREVTAVRGPCIATKSSPCSLQMDKSPCNCEDPAQSKIMLINYKNKNTSIFRHWIIWQPWTVIPEREIRLTLQLPLDTFLRGF